MQAPIGDSARVLPRAEHGGDRAPELGVEILRERLAELALDEGLVAADDRHPILRRELSIVFESLEIFEVLEDLLEQLMVDAEHHIGIHLDEAAIGVVGKSSVARAAREPFDGLVVEAEIEHGVHHAGHRGAAAGTDRHEQRILDIAEFRAGDPAYGVERVAHHRLELVGEPAPELVIDRADLRGDGESRRNGEAEPRHLGKIGALAAKQVAVACRAVGMAGAEGEDPSGLGC